MQISKKNLGYLIKQNYYEVWYIIYINFWLINSQCYNLYQIINYYNTTLSRKKTVLFKD